MRWRRVAPWPALSVEELHGPQGITLRRRSHDVIEMLAEVPDLFDVKMSGALGTDSASRFSREGYQERPCRLRQALTTKPVVGVGRFTSPDTMVSQIRRGVLDFIGGARPSIADPFLPDKIREGRDDEIRECIGCNICSSGTRRARALHAEPDHGRGMAARLASGDSRRSMQEHEGAGRRRRAGGARMRR